MQRSNVRGLGERARPMGERAIDAAPPRDGEVIRTALPDTFDGIRWEIGRMVRYVQEARKDPLVIDTARQVAAHFGSFVQEMSAREGKPIDPHQNKVIQAEGIDLWCRHHFYYVNDPSNVEVIQTPRRMIKQTKIAREVIEHLMEPFYRAMEKEHPEFVRGSYTPPPLYVGDCDEPASLMMAMCAALEIAPVKFRFGGSNGSLHHVWGCVSCDGDWYDSDLTEPQYRLGDFSQFEHYEELEVPV
jgi:hypothetical protein